MELIVVELSQSKEEAGASAGINFWGETKLRYLLLSKLSYELVQF